MRIIRMHCPSQSAQAEPIWRGIARHLYSLITMDAQFGPLDLPGGEGILSKKQTNKISQGMPPMGRSEAVKCGGPLERLQKILVNNAAYDASKAAPRTPPVRPERGNNMQLQARGNRRLSWWVWCYLVPLIMALW